MIYLIYLNKILQVSQEKKYGMIYKDNKWKLIDKNELVDDIFENDIF